MKILHEFSNEPDRYIPSPDSAIRQIEKLPLPYTGNKKKLTYAIYDAITRNHLEFESVIDAFTGSATVAFLFKLMGKRVLANDLMTNAYINAVAFVENPGITLTEDEKYFLIHNENPNRNTFVEDNYLGVQYRPKGKECRWNKFTLKECQYLDNFRANVDDLFGIYAQSLSLAANAAIVMRLPFGNIDQSSDILLHRKRQQSNYGKNSEKHDRRIGIYYDEELNLNFEKWFNKYVNDFMGTGQLLKDRSSEIKIKRACFLANLQQHVLRDCFVGGRMNKGQVLAEMNERLSHQKNQLKARSSLNDGTTEMDFISNSGLPGQGIKWWSTADVESGGSCFAVNMDVIDLLQSNFAKADLVYLDPPYGGQSSNYAVLYRFFEEYIYSCPLEDLPHIQLGGNRFVGRSEYEKHFTMMLEAAHHIPIWLFSYNDDSWKTIEYIEDIIKRFKKHVKIELLTDQYRYFYRKVQGRKDKAREFLVIAW